MSDDKNLQEIQFLEQNMQALIYQKQAFQTELAETQSAIKETEKSKEDVYKLVGQILIKTPKDKILEELKSKEKVLDLRLKTFEKQEAQFSERLQELQTTVAKPKKPK